jgi:coproporphyrinogen III oxidase-like Fe-S oxidoreductase
MPALEEPAQGPEDVLLDMVMLGLRTADGLDLRLLEQRFGRQQRLAVVGTVAAAAQQGLAVLSGSSGQQLGTDRQELQEATSVRLTDPDGFLVSNDVISDVFAALGDLKPVSDGQSA